MLRGWGQNPHRHLQFFLKGCPAAKSGGRSGDCWKIHLDHLRDQGGLKIMPFPQGQHYFSCLGTCPKIVSSLWELHMLPLLENSKQAKYWKHKDIPAYKGSSYLLSHFWLIKIWSGTSLSHLPNLNIPKDSWLQSIFTTDQYSIHHRTNYLVSNVACSWALSIK